ncbi:type VI secretion system contractile sheath small subunit [Rhodobacteraceae bacterium F11138]|nr:type VI secretion system contractile sheath small subunit [Rhodobacteraceae bacterium F11138]
MTDSSQKFIARNRAPRVQIEYDVELYGSEKKVQLPFVMGVMSDLAGKSRVAQPSVANRKFLEIDVDNFDDRMQAMQPRAAFSVPNTLTGQGNLEVDLTFEKMDDFSPQAIAAKIEPLRELLRARTELANLATYMDGKVGAETLIERILQDPDLLTALSALTVEHDRTDATLDALRAAASDEETQEDATGAALDALRAAAPDEETQEDATDTALEALRAAAPESVAEVDAAEAALENLRATVPHDTVQDDTKGAVLAALRAAAPDETGQQDNTDAILDDLQSVSEAPETREDVVGSALDGLRDQAPEETAQTDTADQALDALRAAEPAPGQTAEDESGLALEGLRESPVADPPPQDSGDDILDGLRSKAVDDPTQEPADQALQQLRAAPDSQTEQDNTVESALDALRDVAPAEPGSDETGADVLDALAADSGARDDEPGETTDHILQTVARETPNADPDADTGLENLDSLLDSPDPSDTPEPAVSDILDALAVDEQDDDDRSVAAIGADGSDTDDVAEPAHSPQDAESHTALDDLLDDDGKDTAAEPGDAGGSLAGLDLDDLLGDAIDPDPVSPASEDDPIDEDDALDELTGGDAAEQAATEPDDPVDVLDAGPVELSADLDDLLSDDADPMPREAPATAQEDGAIDALDDLLGDLGDGPEHEPQTPEPATDDTAAEGEDDLDALLADPAHTEPGVEIPEPPASAPQGGAGMDAEFTFGRMTGDRPEPQRLNRKRFRLAVMGDFSGRAARGQIETADALAARPAIRLDPDTLDDVIAGFATKLVLPIGKDGAGVELSLAEMDDLHPDELYSKVALFSELIGLRAQLASGATADHAATTLRSWAEAHGTPITAPRRSSSGNAVPADRRLSDFQKLIGDTAASLTRPTPVEEMLARIVGPHIRAVPDADNVAMQAAVSDALSAAMRLVLHHPEFQSIESQWRSIDLIARSIEVDDTLEVMLYDISAEEIAADLAGADDLAQSGFARLLTEAPLDEETGRGGYSALIGMYTFEETPPHAELLGRIGRVAAHVDAPFLAALSPGFMDTPKDERHPLVASAWDGLRGMPEAGHLGLLSPRFLLRRPYGAKSEPIYEFEFEEFTMTEGLSGMLWANPVVLAAILLAKSYREHGAGMGLWSVMSLGDMPYHFVTDQFGDQVALPCTERNLTLERVEQVMARGIMPVVSIKGRDEIRLASFQSLAGGDILGPWSDVPPPPPSPPAPVSPPEPAADADTAADLGLDDLLAGFGDDAPDPAAAAGSDDMDADLAALLEDL